MAVKAVNETAGPDGFVPTLLFSGAYSRVFPYSPPSPMIIRRTKAIQKAMKALRKAVAKRAVNNALSTRNGPAIDKVLSPARPSFRTTFDVVVLSCSVLTNETKWHVQSNGHRSESSYQSKRSGLPIEL